MNFKSIARTSGCCKGCCCSGRVRRTRKTDDFLHSGRPRVTTRDSYILYPHLRYRFLNARRTVAATLMHTGAYNTRISAQTVCNTLNTAKTFLFFLVQYACISPYIIYILANILSSR